MSKDERLNGLLFSQSNYEFDSEEESFHYKTNSKPPKFPSVNIHANNFLNASSENHEEFDLDDDYDHHNSSSEQDCRAYFPKINGPSVQFEQNSLMLSKRFDSSKMMQNKQDEKILKTILENKQKQQEKVNEVIDQQFRMLLQEKQHLQTMNDGYKKHFGFLESQVQAKNKQIIELNQKLKQAESDKLKALQTIDKQHAFFLQMKEQIYQCSKQIELKDNELQSKERQLEAKQNEIQTLIEAKQQLQDKMGMIINQNNDMINFSTPSNRTAKNLQKEVDRYRKQKIALQTQLQFLKRKIDSHQTQVQRLQEDYKKKMTSKDKKYKDLQRQMENVTTQLQKIKKNYDSNMQNIKSTNLQQNRQIQQKQQKTFQLENRLRSLNEDSKKKQQRIQKLLLQLTERNRQLQEKEKNYQQMKLKKNLNEEQKDLIIQKLQSQQKKFKQQKLELQNNLTNEIKLRKQYESSKKDLQSLKKQLIKIEKEKTEKETLVKQYKKKYEQLMKELKKKNDDSIKKQSSNKQIQEKTEIMMKQQEKLELANKNQENIISQYKNRIVKLTKELQQQGKLSEINLQLSNKIKILESRLIKVQQPQQCFEDVFNSEERIQALEQVILQKQREIRQLKTMKRSVSLVQIQKYQEQLQEKDRIIQQLQLQNEHLEEQLNFKDKELEYMHQRFNKMQRQNREILAQKKILHSSFYDTSYTESMEEELRKQFSQKAEAYQLRIKSYEQKLKSLTKKLRQYESKVYNPQKDSKFQISQLKSRIKQLNDSLLRKERFITPQSLSQDQTVDFLVRVMSKVNRSNEMIRLLSHNQQFRQCLKNMSRELRK